MRVIDVDLTKCQGHGKCYMVAPSFFDFADDHGRARFTAGPIDPLDRESMEKAKAAVRACPEYALSLRDTVTEERR